MYPYADIFTSSLIQMIKNSVCSYVRNPFIGFSLMSFLGPVISAWLKAKVK